jgi:hypothetical protein
MESGSSGGAYRGGGQSPPRPSGLNLSERLPGGSPRGAAVVLRRLRDAVAGLDPIKHQPLFDETFLVYAEFAAEVVICYGPDRAEAIFEGIDEVLA